MIRVSSRPVEQLAAGDSFLFANHLAQVATVHIIDNLVEVLVIHEILLRRNGHTSLVFDCGDTVPVVWTQ